MNEPTDSIAAEPPKKRRRRRWYQFNLASILLLLTAVAIGSAYYRSLLDRCRAQAIAAQKLEVIGAEVTYITVLPAWLAWLPQAEMCKIVTIVDLEGKRFAEGSLGPLAELPDLERLYLALSSVTDDDLEPVAQLTKIRRISLWRTKVSNDGLEHLKQLEDLELLDIKHTKNIDERALNNLRHWPNLMLLKQNFEVSNTGLKVLVNHRYRPVESLHAVHVSDEGIEDLLKLIRIENLSIQPECSNESLFRVMELPQLKLFQLTGRSDIKPQEFQELKPGLQLYRSLPIRKVNLSEVADQWADNCIALDIGVFREYNAAMDAIYYRQAPQTRFDRRLLPIVLTLKEPRVQIDIVLDHYEFDWDQLPRFREVEAVRIVGKNFDPKQLACLGQLPKLEELNLTMKLDNEVFDQVSKLDSLKHLALSSLYFYPEYDDDACDALASLKNLETFSIHSTRMNDRHVEFISHCPKLRRVYLYNTGIAAGTLERVSQLPNVDELLIHYCHALKKEDLEIIKGMKQLRTCKMYGRTIHNNFELKLPTDVAESLPLLENDKYRFMMFRKPVGQKAYPRLPPLGME
ncbi:MAG: hypothetical protein COA78_27420 [Blastopirellula sp.]|nr:MAG: hypothetical protein COA78_27420 [Blastopirellula sp.]